MVRRLVLNEMYDHRATYTPFTWNGPVLTYATFVLFLKEKGGEGNKILV